MHKRLVWIIAAVFVESLQVLIIAALVSMAFPVSNQAFVAQNFLKETANMKLDRQIQLYRFFVLANLLLMAAFLFRYRRIIDDRPSNRSLKAYIIVQANIIFLQLLAVFKIIVYKSPVWAWHLLWAGVVLAVLTRLFWREIYRSFDAWWEKEISRVSTWGWVFDIMTVVVITISLYLADMDQAIRMIMGINNGASWTQVINASSAWGTLSVYFLSKAAQLMGGLQFSHFLNAAVLLTIVYFILFYFLMAAWCKSRLLSFAAVCMAIKLHLFHTGVAPFVWAVPHQTLLRFLPDILILWALWKHLTFNKIKYLWAAAILEGMYLAYMLDTGFALLIAFYVYLIFVFPKAAERIRSHVKVIALVPLIVALLMLGLVEGSSAFTITFWKNTLQGSWLLSQGLGAVPFFECLRTLNFFAFAMAFIIPLLYVFTILAVSAEIFLKKSASTDFYAVILSVYGLLLYQHFVWYSSLSNYYAAGVMFIPVVVFWVQRRLETYPAKLVRVLLAAAAGYALLALWLNTWFINYPHVLHGMYQ